MAGLASHSRAPATSTAPPARAHGAAAGGGEAERQGQGQCPGQCPGQSLGQSPGQSGLSEASALVLLATYSASIVSWTACISLFLSVLEG